VTYSRSFAFIRVHSLFKLSPNVAVYPNPKLKLLAMSGGASFLAYSYRTEQNYLG
jgi:hypothetical protein